MKYNNQLRFLSYGVIAYMIMAFAWWAILLFNKNRDAFQARSELLRLEMTAEGGAEYRDLARHHRRQEWMILGEASVFGLAMIMGIWLISRAYNKEIQVGIQQKNFLLSVTHEFKSPLSGIKLMLETLTRRKLDQSRVKELAGSGLEEAERLHVLLNNILFAAKLESGYEFNFETLDIMQLLMEVKKKMKEHFQDMSSHSLHAYNVLV